MAVRAETMRIGELAKRAGVSVTTIKYYIREGLLPPAPMKTGRTMAYYDAAYLERLLLVRRLREQHFLPIRVIRTVLAEHADEPLTSIETRILERLGDRVVKKLDPAPSRDLSRFQLRPDELEMLEQMGLADEEFLDALERMEQAGLSREVFPLEGLGHYVELLGELARREVRSFLRHAVAAIPESELGPLAERAVEVTEPALNLIRRRLIRREIQRHTSSKERA